MTRRILKWITSISLLLSLEVSGDENAAKPAEADDTADINIVDWNISQGFVAKDFSVWLNKFHHVDLVVYNHLVAVGKPLVADGKVHPGIVKTLTVTLSEEEIRALKTTVIGRHSSRLGGMCYLPHHGFIFYDENDKVLAHLEMCFMCDRYRSYPAQGLSDHWDVKALKALIARRKLPVDLPPTKWKEFFLKHGMDAPELGPKRNPSTPKKGS